MTATRKILDALKGLLRRRRFGAGLAATAMLAVSASPALAWYDNAWTYRKALTVDTKASEAGEGLKHYPVLVRLDSSQFNFADAQKNGADLRFVDQDDKTVLNYQIESFDPSLGMAMIWVDLPDVPAGSQHQVWMYYGNKSAQAASNPAALFDVQYRGVYHFASGAEGQDSSAAHADLQGVTPASAAAIGAGAAFTGTPVAMPAAIDPAAGFTVQAWVHEKTHADNAAILTIPGALTAGFKQGVPYLEVGTSHVDATLPAQGDWTAIAVVAEQGKTTLYVNGKPAATVTGALPAASGPAVLGTGFTGEMDEVRVSASARSPALIATDYAAQKSGAALIGYGADEKASGMGFGYFGYAFANLTTDAWVVIGLLVVMAMASWWVMWSKYLNWSHTKTANNRFLALFHKHPTISSLEQALLQMGSERRKVDKAPTYRIFRTGVAELHKRGDLRGKALTEETVESIRSALDNQQILENQKLDSQMVLLTICIAGGPFIGLFGTVLGVVITFAAVGMAGEVNVNAIAPGISASLIATLFGLFVAIPALFGYNILSTLNSGEADKARGFADQFVTGLAEAQRDAALAA